MFQRRQFLKMAGLAAGSSMLTGLPRPAFGSPAWGDIPTSIWPASPDLKVLEIHMLGGVAPFESFYYRDTVNHRTRGFDSEIATLVWNTISSCTNPSAVPTGLETHPATFFANDSNTKPVKLGPFAKPLWRSDLRDRMRVIVLSHNLMPHEAAIPFALTGLRLGNPNQASLGAAIAHRYLALDIEAGTPRTLPYAYALLPQSAFVHDLLFSMLSASGRHPGVTRPLVLNVGPGFATFISQLQRTNMSAEKDALLDQYRGQYRDWLRFAGSGAPTRSVGFSDYDTSVGTLVNASSLSSFLSGTPTTINTEVECAREPATSFNSAANPTKTALEAAAFLLTRPPVQRARYVCVVDTGINPLNSYDVHYQGSGIDNHPSITGSNLWNLFQTLSGLINAPGDPADPNKLDLDNTLIVINTEFGRTPFKSTSNTPDSTSLGRDHWPQAYVNVLIGGPITSRGVAGSISDAADLGAVADISYSPTDVRAAVLVAAGINPFESENYAVGQLSAPFGSSSTHEAAMESLRSVLLGVS